ncbi:Fatty acid hydroxylase superfamily protein [Polynucleobacter meluiroseus]|uniref:Fatty acid hydroxylase superfamily protein n=2 Tax=Polynucleobacter meluiroseus TaxID=1938814 RepID=A0A240DZC8_9BURK|nr:Fatty acid hydroxylase superfamily protein [Polynucleobacter meluiroseus]
MLTPGISILITLAVLSLLFCWERMSPLHQYSEDRGWLWRLCLFGGLGIFLTTLIGIYIVPLLGNIALFPQLAHQFSTCPAWLNGLLGYFCISFFVYWWHRLRHNSNFAWRIFHQVHHSTHRLQALTALYAHPSDFLANSVIINLATYWVLGFDTDSAAWATLWVGIFEFWEHTNISTPRWLGYIIVRPEMHRIHHERERHANNYGLPIWDMLFGTYENSSRVVECGFQLDSERKVKHMLACKEIK